MADRLTASKLGLQPSVVDLSVGIDRGFNGDTLPDRRLQNGSGSIGHRIDVNDAIGLLVDPKDHMLQPLAPRLRLTFSTFRSFARLPARRLSKLAPK